MANKSKNRRYGKRKTEIESLSIKIGRNDPCPCGKVNTRFSLASGLHTHTPVKFKKCCMNKTKFIEKDNVPTNQLKNIVKI